MSFNPKLLEKTLVCTKCRANLVQVDAALVCVSPECRMKYSIIHEIPNMLVDDAAVVGTQEWSAAMQHSGRDPATGARS
ncbi:MAG: hypothetical protein JSS02_30650 [Planctomycetes bacterium]|nr:hypothetical protein [Planctomycetota bacterium]